MEDFENSLVPVYLRDWGLSEETIKKNCDNEITIDLLSEIQDNDLKELVPLLKERILFRVGVRKLEKITHETASEDTNSAPASPTTCSSCSSFAEKTNADPKQIPNVRGAPAIAIVGCLSLAVELEKDNTSDKKFMRQEIEGKLNYLVSARPTAVNIKLAAEELINLANSLCADESVTPEEFKDKFISNIEEMLTKDIEDNKAIGRYGCEAILKNMSGDGPVKILTHCNTGSLATAGYGTALGVIRSLHETKKLEHVYCTETRPYNQGARLTAYELVHEKIPSTLIVDSVVSALMNSRRITAVVVGADRVAANGDTANKIGTYQIAIAAKHHGVPFYVAAPLTSIDRALTSGERIKIEERPDREMTHVGEHRIAAPGINCWNPSFDVTPASLITGIITEKGVFAPDRLHEIVVK